MTRQRHPTNDPREACGERVACRNVDVVSGHHPVEHGPEVVLKDRARLDPEQRIDVVGAILDALGAVLTWN